jgi:putative DNA primase/helicase
MFLLFIGYYVRSVLCDILCNILGKFYIAADKKIFINQDHSPNHTSHLIPLLNARLAVLSETQEGEKLNEALIKALTGNDQISCRELYGKQFSFKPNAKYIILTNNKPTFNVNCVATVDRIKYIPFNARFTDNPKDGESLRDTKFIERLKTEYIDEVFAWLCLGANAYYRSNGNIQVPKSLQDAKDNYIKEIDNVSQFIADKCSKGDEFKMKQTVLYEQYKNYCSDNGFTYLKNTEFYKRLDSLGFKKVVIKGYPHFKNICVNNYID